MTIVDHLNNEPNPCCLCRFWGNHTLRVGIVAVIIIPAVCWFAIVNKLQCKIPEFWIGAYFSFIVAYLGFLYEQSHQLKVKWYRALVELEFQCYDLWNRVENERGKLSKCFELNAACYEFPPDLSLPSETLNSLGRVGIKNAAFHVRWAAEDLTNSLKLTASTAAEQGRPMQLVGLMGDWYKACDRKAADLQNEIVEIQKSIRYFLDNDKPKILMPPRFSERKWKGDMESDPFKIGNELKSQFSNISDPFT